MTTQDLRALFLEEHRRDKKLTLINFIFISVLVFVVLGILAWLLTQSGTGIMPTIKEAIGSVFNESTPLYFKLIIPAVIIGYILYPFYLMWKLSKRPQEIETMMSKIENGGKAASIDDYEEYKITIPLLKINLKLCPVTFAMIYLHNDLQVYKFPIRKMHLPEMKLILSQANIERLNEIRSELYSESGVSANNNAATQNSVGSQNNSNAVEDNTPTPIKSVEEFKSFIDSDLKGALEQLEGNRKSTVKGLYILIPVIVLAIGGFVAYTMYNSNKAMDAGDYSGGISTSTIFIFMGAMIALSFGYSMYSRRKVAAAGTTINHTPVDFKTDVFNKMVKFINPTVEYMPLGHIGVPEFMESGLFTETRYDINGNDQIVGRHSGVPFIMCDLTVQHQKSFSNEKDGPDEVFFGQFFVARFNKRFSTPVFIKPKNGVTGFFTDNSINSYTNSLGDKVTLEDPEFMNMFSVYAQDQIEARYILTPSLMERIKELAKRTKGQYYIAFNNNKITVANNSRINNFESGYFTSLTKNDNEKIVTFYTDLCDQFAIIDELKLNVNIWG